MAPGKRDILDETDKKKKKKKKHMEIRHCWPHSANSLTVWKQSILDHSFSQMFIHFSANLGESFYSATSAHLYPTFHYDLTS